MTYFAGTFVRHPLALAAAKSALEYIKRESPGVQQRVNSLTASLVNDLTKLFKRIGAPFAVSSCSRKIIAVQYVLKHLLFLNSI